MREPPVTPRLVTIIFGGLREKKILRNEKYSKHFNPAKAVTDQRVLIPVADSTCHAHPTLLNSHQLPLQERMALLLRACPK